MKSWAMVLVFAGIAGFLCFFRLGSTTLYETDEGFAANRALSLVDHSDWRVTYDRFNEGGMQLKKPPLLYWMVAALYKTIGINMWSVRLPSALAGFLVMLLTWRLARTWFGEIPALTGALMFGLVPFHLFHIRTGMLDMPLLACSLLAVYLAGWFPRSFITAVGAGLACSAALMLKAAAGLPALLAAVVFLFVRGGWSRRTLFRLAILLGVAVLPVLTYLAILPAEVRTEMLQAYTVSEGSERMLDIDPLRRLHAFTTPLAAVMLPLIPAAGFGLLMILRPAFLRKRSWQWLILLALIAVPALLGGVVQIRPYPRYFIPAFWAIAVTAGLYFGCAATHRTASYTLAGYAAAVFFLLPAPWSWIITGIAAAAGIVLQLIPLREDRNWRGLFIAWALAGSIAWTLHAAQPDIPYGVREDEMPKPALAKLAAAMADEIPPGELVVAEVGTKVHIMQFYTRRRICSLSYFLLAEYRPGREVEGIMAEPFLISIPYVTLEPGQHEGMWHRVRIRLSDDPGIHGIILNPHKEFGSILAALDALGVTYEAIVPFVYIRGVPQTVYGEWSDIPLAGHRLTRAHPRDVPPGTVLSFSDIGLSGTVGAIDLFPARKNESYAGLRVERASARGPVEVVLQLERQPAMSYRVEDGQVIHTSDRRIRLRFPSTPADELRLVFDLEAPVRVAGIKAAFTGN